MCALLQDKIEELQASLHAVGAEAKGLSEQNSASEQELQVRLSASVRCCCPVLFVVPFQPCSAPS